jgi:transcriptional regulator NrdR family protein
MKCSKCGISLRVLRTIHEDGLVFRKRICSNCGETVCTVEQLILSNDFEKAFNRKVQEKYNKKQLDLKKEREMLWNFGK